MSNTVSFFKVGDSVRLTPEAGYGDVVGKLASKGRKFLTVKLTDGPLVRRIWPAWVRRA